MIALAVLPLPIHAQEEAPVAPEPSTETIVVTASRAPQPLSRIPASIDVIERAEIEGMRADGVTELLRHRPGLHVDAPGARGSRSSVYTRGLDPNHTLVMIDGIVVNDETNSLGGSYDFSTLGSAGIERIEIVRGPVSALYGSAAIAGAINIFPRRPEEDTVGIDVSGGRYGYYRGQGFAGGRRGPVDLFVSGGYTDESDPESIGSFRGGNVLSSMGVSLPGGGDLRGLVRFAQSDNEAFPQFSGGPELAVVRDFETRDIHELSTGLTWNQPLVERLDIQGRFTLNRRRENRFTPPVLSEEGGFPEVPGEPGTHERYLRYGFALQGTIAVLDDVSVFDELAVTVGGDIYQEDGKSRGDLDFGAFTLPGGADFDLDRLVGATFIETQLATNFGLVAQAGLRVDIPEGRSEEFLPRVGAAYTYEDFGTTVQASWGQGFKLPSFFALANPIAGNDGLIPERSKGLDVSIAQELFGQRLHARATYFDIEVDNLIDFNPDSFRLENLSSSESRGTEIEIGILPFTDFDLRGHVTYVSASGESDDGRSRLRNRPRWRGGFAATWQLHETLSARLVGLFVGDVISTSAVTGDVRLSGYQRFDLALDWSPRDWATISLAIDNLADEEYEEAVGFPAVSVRPRAGIRLTL
jgi:iron complex outermembrane receptor protein/vitamin B12 transporter